MNWFNKTYSIDYLKQAARIVETHEMYMMDFLKLFAGVVPRESNYKKIFSAYPLLDETAMKAEYLASYVLEWDQYGKSTPAEWIDMLERECTGNPKRDIIMKALERATNEISS